MKRLCARSICRQPLKVGETFFNLSTRGFYCQACAVMLNRVNEKDALELYGGPLCVPVCLECGETEGHADDCQLVVDTDLEP